MGGGEKRRGEKRSTREWGQGNGGRGKGGMVECWRDSVFAGERIGVRYGKRGTKKAGARDGLDLNRSQRRERRVR